MQNLNEENVGKDNISKRDSWPTYTFMAHIDSGYINLYNPHRGILG